MRDPVTSRHNHCGGNNWGQWGSRALELEYIRRDFIKGLDNKWSKRHKKKGFTLCFKVTAFHQWLESTIFMQRSHRETGGLANLLVGDAVRLLVRLDMSEVPVAGDTWAVFPQRHKSHWELFSATVFYGPHSNDLWSIIFIIISAGLPFTGGVS